MTRHFGESLFLAAYLFPGARALQPHPAPPPHHVLDFGSGAGFPGLPLKIYVPELRLTLAESNHKKAVFLAEVIRALRLSDTSVFTGRLQSKSAGQPNPSLPEGIASPDLVTMRAVERFEVAVLTAATLVRGGAGGPKAGKLALLIGQSQAPRVPQLIPEFSWEEPVAVPQSRERVLLLGRYQQENVSSQ